MGALGVGKWLFRWTVWYAVVAFVAFFVLLLYFVMDTAGWPTMAAMLLWLFVGVVLYAVVYPVYSGVVKPRGNGSSQPAK